MLKLAEKLRACPPKSNMAMNFYLVCCVDEGIKTSQADEIDLRTMIEHPVECYDAREDMGFFVRDLANDVVEDMKARSSGRYWAYWLVPPAYFSTTDIAERLQEDFATQQAFLLYSGYPSARPSDLELKVKIEKSLCDPTSLCGQFHTLFLREDVCDERQLIFSSFYVEEAERREKFFENLNFAGGHHALSIL